MKVMDRQFRTELRLIQLKNGIPNGIGANQRTLFDKLTTIYFSEVSVSTHFSKGEDSAVQRHFAPQITTVFIWDASVCIDPGKMEFGWEHS
jgi:hypothetical protein